MLTGNNTLNGYGRVIDGDDDTGYFVKSGTLTINNATLQNFVTKGGAGSGGGAGLGGAIFVNSDATVILNNVSIIGNSAIGGKGGYGSGQGTLNGFSKSSLGSSYYGHSYGHGGGYGGNSWGDFGFGGEDDEKGGFGGGVGSEYYRREGGEGGSGYGGGIFVRDDGTLIIKGNATFGDNFVKGGDGERGGYHSYSGDAGDAAGTDLFMMKGSTVLLDAGEGNTITFNGNGYGSSIADDSKASINDTSIASGNGAGLTIKSGLVIFNGKNTYTGQTKISGGVLQAQDGYGIHANSNIRLDGGVLQSSGTFSRWVGEQSNRIQWTGSGGFAAAGGDLTVRLNNGQELEWSRNNFVSGDNSLIFGSTSATHKVYFVNSIDLNDRDRSIKVKANEDNSNWAVLTGKLSDGGLIVGDSQHTGVLVLTNRNTYRDGTTIKGGTLALKDSGTLYERGDVKVYSGAHFDISMSGNQKIGELSGYGTVHLGQYNLTVNHDCDTTFAGIIKDGGLGDGEGGSFTKKGHGNLTLSGHSTYTGKTHLDEGSITLTGSLLSKEIKIDECTVFNNKSGGFSALAAVTNDGTLNLDESDTLTSLVNTGTINGHCATLTAETYALNDGSVINANLGTGEVTANGAVKLNGTSDAETFKVESGTTTLGSAERLNDEVDLTIEANAKMILGGSETIGSLFGAGSLVTDTDFCRTTTLTVDDGEFSGVISGGADLVKVSEGELVLTGANTFTGSTKVKGGTLEISGEGSLASDYIKVYSNGTLEVFNGGLACDATLKNEGLVNIDEADVKIASYISCDGTLDGTATLTANTYTLNNNSVVNANIGTGTVTVTGDVWLNGTSDAETVTINADSNLWLGAAERINDEATVNVYGVLTLGGIETIKYLNGTGKVDIQGYKLIVTEGGDYSGTVDAEATEFIKEGLGTLKLNGKTETLNVLIDEGVLQLGENGELIATGDAKLDIVGSITVKGGAKLVLDPASLLSYALLNGAGTVDAVNFTNAEDSKVGGTLSFTGNFTNNGVFAPGNSPGITNIALNYVENAQLELELGGRAGPGIDPNGWDQVRVGGTVTLNPTSELLVSSYNGFSPRRGDVFQVISDAAGDPIRVNGLFGSVLFDVDGAGGSTPTNNAAILFDVATGQLNATGLNARNSKFSDLGDTDNQRRAARALFRNALVGPNQIDSATTGGRLALQIVDAAGSPDGDLERYTPEYYGAMADYAFAGDRSISHSIQDRVSLFAPLSAGDMKRGAVFAGFAFNDTANVEDADITRRDYFVGGDIVAAQNFSIGAALLMNEGSISSHQGTADIEGIGGLLYGRYEMKGFAFWGTFSYTNYDFDASRDTVNGDVNGSTNADGISGLIGVGYKGWNVGPVSLAPRASLIYSYFTMDGFSELGAIDALSNSGYDASILTSELSLSALWSKEIAGHTLSVEVVGGLEADLARSQEGSQMQVVSSPGIEYNMLYEDRDRVRGVGRLNIGYDVWKNGMIYGGYEGRTGEGGNHLFRLGMRVNF
ncbi:autotransporter domain-containing protein [Prosthecobacter debontii]|uniref:autotransporter domain-containing protein n=1 Tax=Prosthecobacter debontii TaxID=48467 RepID=UPI001590D8DA|nr:autotransporter domain-containing protein [Prosthecobacter debontii]